MKYIQRWDDEPFEVEAKKITRWSCCDCGLTHDIVFANGRGIVGVAARVNNRATAARRRGNNGDVKLLEERAKKHLNKISKEFEFTEDERGCWLDGFRYAMKNRD